MRHQVPITLLCLTLSGPTFAQQVLNVPSAFPTIQGAIAAAQPGDTVRVQPGTYNEVINFLGKAIRLESTGGALATTIDTQGKFIMLPDFSTARAPIGFYNNEGPGSVVNGFTLTGVDFQGGSKPAGIFCGFATPTIEDCRIIDNRGALAGGLVGNATLVRCELIGNSTSSGAGAIYGAPTLIDCLIADNVSPNEPGGGLHATAPCEVIRCKFFRNVAGVDGFDGYSGGAVFGPANLTDSVIAFNRATPLLIPGGPELQNNTTGGGLHFVGAVRRCVVYGNYIGSFPSFPISASQGSGGGIGSALEVVDSIVYGNLPDEMRPGVNVRYSTVGGGYPGIGNLALDPLFVDPLGEDFRLQAGSPCIDTGDPTSPINLDGSRADQGAFPFLKPLTSSNGFGLSIASGGTQSLNLKFDAASPGNDLWLLLGSQSGVGPTPIDAVTVPLSLDAYTLATLSGANGPLFQNTLGVYLSSAPVNMSIQLPAGVLSPALVGLTLHHAVLRIDATGLPFVAEASNPLPLTLQP